MTKITSSSQVPKSPAKEFNSHGGWHSTEVEFGLLNPATPGSILDVPQIFIILDVAQIYRWHFECKTLNIDNQTIHVRS